jgi:hypothetical protein
MPGPVPGIHVFSAGQQKDVDGRDKPGHDEFEFGTVPALRSSVKNAAARPGHGLGA